MEDRSTKAGMGGITKIIVALSIVIVCFILFLLSLHFLLARIFCAPPDVFVTTKLTDEISSNHNFQFIVGMATQGKMLPNESRNIFACNDRNRDPAYWLIFELPRDKIPSFIEKITERKFEEMVNGISSAYSRVNEGPRNCKGGSLGESYWDLHRVENGRHCEGRCFYCGVDIERSKIFLCYRTM